MTTTPKHRLRWYQYSLRSLFVLTLLVAVAGSWFAVKRQQVERERAAVKAIEELGGRASYEWEVDNRVRIVASLLADDEQSVSPHLPPLSQPPGPAWLRAWLGDDFFAHLWEVSLRDTQATDATLAIILRDLPRLEVMDLSLTQVTDDGVEDLQGLNHLEWLGLIDTKVTDDGVKRLQQALPNCKIVR